MPDRFIKTIAGIHGGALVIVGLGYIATGLTWIFAPSYTRATGLDWIQAGWVSQDSIGALWLISGVIALIAGMFSKGHKRLEAIGYAAALFTALMVIGWFVWAAVLGDLYMLALIIVQLVWPTTLVWWIWTRADTTTTTEIGVRLHPEGEER